MQKARALSAPAKINLYLHITGRRPDGYHTLDSLVVFADGGDEVDVAVADDFSFAVRGPFAGAVPLDDDNLVVRAARGLSALLGRDAACAIMLTKNLPVAAGIGGGSADAAAVVRGLLRLWDIAPDDVPGLPAFLLSLGADVPVCFAGRASVMRGIGDIVVPLDLDVPFPALLVNPLVPCATPDVFAHFKGVYRAENNIAGDVDDYVDDYIARQDNDLTGAACLAVPEIAQVLAVLKDLRGVKLARMSGSGATCFALFPAIEDARAAETVLRARYPQWWMMATVLNHV